MKLIITVGLPRSGKTTWALTQSNPIVSPDAIRLALHGQPFAAEAEPFVWAIAMTMVTALFGAGHDTVVVDGCHATKKRRDFWAGPWEREFKVFGGPEMREECHARAINTMEGNHLIGVNMAIDRMADNWEPIENSEDIKR